MQRKKISIIDRLIDALGITQKEFADRLLTSTENVGGWKKRDISAQTAVRIVKEFPQADVWFLLTGEGNPIKATQSAVSAFSDCGNKEAKQVGVELNNELAEIKKARLMMLKELDEIKNLKVKLRDIK